MQKIGIDIGDSKTYSKNATRVVDGSMLNRSQGPLPEAALWGCCFISKELFGV